MELKLPTPEFRPEPAPVQPEIRHENAGSAPEFQASLEDSPEQAAITEAVSTQMPAISPVPPSVSTDDTTTPSVVDDLPTIANDDDLIEKEWVDKAKKIISETKEDPYLREQEVSRLQADYLKKRYGRELGSSN